MAALIITAWTPGYMPLVLVFKLDRAAMPNPPAGKSVDFRLKPVPATQP